MEAIKIDANSWHYKIVKLVERQPNDICAYRKAFMISVLIMALMGSLLTVGWWVLINVILGVIFSMFYGVGILNEIAIIGMLAGVTFGLLLGIPALVSWYQWRKRDLNKGPGVVTLAYRSWKEKYCAPVVIE